MLAYKGTIADPDTDVDEDDSDTAVKVSFTVTTALEGQAIDLTPPYTATATALSASGLDNVCLVTYVDDYQLINDAAWTVTFIGKNNADYLLESGEQAVITVWLTNYAESAYALGTDSSDPFIDDEDYLLDIYDTFTIEVKGDKGSALVQERNLPARLDTVMDLN
jgi:archaellin